MKVNSIYKSASLVIIITLISKLLGFIREAAIASTFGATKLTDSYIIAVTIYTTFFVIGYEVINNVAVPIYIKLYNKGEDFAQCFTGQILKISGIITVILVLITEALTPLLVKLYAPGFNNEIYNLTVALTRIMLPLLLVTLLTSISSSILISKERFLPTALMGIPNHILVLVYIILFGKSFCIKRL